MTEKITDEQLHPTEIQFGDSAKWHIEALCQGRIDSTEAAAQLKFLFDQIEQVAAKEQFITKLKAFVLQTSSQSSTENEESTVEKGNKLFEILVQKMRYSEVSPDLTRRFGVNTNTRVKQITQ